MAKFLYNLGCLVFGMVSGIYVGRYGSIILSELFGKGKFERVNWEEECAALDDEQCDCQIDEDEL